VSFFPLLEFIVKFCVFQRIFSRTGFMLSLIKVLPVEATRGTWPASHKLAMVFPLLSSPTPVHTHCLAQDLGTVVHALWN